MDEIYYAFIINDMMAKAATGQLSAEDAVKWATQQCEIIMKKWAGKA
jgi:multiple sugar transport system substrate-binding protein